ncbi:MAG: non-ribosomal peptide synthetase [Stenotrophomonas acidaminiphila]|nr:MAG: non-ribosomal peptide synthetase [Stenotrophomonas acidaminiphila]
MHSNARHRTAVTHSSPVNAPLSYWQERQSAGLPVVELPTDVPRTARAATVSEHVQRRFPLQASAALDALARDAGVEVHDILFAAFCVLVGRLCGEDSIAVGTAAGAMGPLPLSVTLEGTDSFRTLIGRAHGERGAALRHAEAAPDAWRAAIDALATPSVLFGTDVCPAGTELVVSVTRDGEQLLAQAGYDGTVFTPSTIERWLEAYETVLSAGLLKPDAAIGALPITSSTQLAALHALQPARTPRDAHLRLTDLIAAQALATPHRVALRHQGEQWDFARLRARGLQIAHALRARGIGRGSLVGLCLDRRPDMLCAALGVLDAGAAYVPLDPAYPRDRLDYMARDADLALLLAQTDTVDLLDWPAARTLLLDRDLPAASDTLLPLPDDERAATPESPAYVIYTSGSTGRPKGVVVPHRAVVNFLLSMRHTPGMTADDRLVAVTTLSFDIAVLELFLPLCTGAEIILASREEAMDGPSLAGLLREHDATLMQATPASWRMLLETGWRPPAGFKALCGGEALPTDLVRPLCSDGAQLWNMYGPTETTVWSTCESISADDAYLSIGRPIDNTTVWILDARLQPCPIGVPGEIWIGGDGVTLGYLHREELTRERFIDDPMSPGGWLYRTGDRGRWRNDGRLEHMGRLDFQVKVRGYRIELGEIEASLSECDGVERTVVVTREDRPGDVRIVAYLTPTPGAVPAPAALRQQLRERLPGYMVPQHFVTLQTFPLLPNGKIDRKSLPPPGDATATATTPPVAPRNDGERRIADLVRTVLSRQDVGIHDDFFAIGGHSLLAARLLENIRRTFAVDLPLRTVFDAPTIAGLAAAVQTGVAMDAPVLERRTAHGGPAPLTLMQERIWIHGQLNPGSAAYNIPLAFHLRGAFDEAAFARAFARVVTRQATLRTRIIQTEDGPAQIETPADEAAAVLPPIIDAPDLPQPAQRDWLERTLRTLAGAPIDLTQSPSFHTQVFRLNPQEHVFFLMPHHALWDGGSTDLFCREMDAAYTTECGTPAADLPDLAVDYADYAYWHRQTLDSALHGQHTRERLEQWQRLLQPAGLPPPLATDRPRTPGTPRAADMSQLSLDPDLTARLRQVARDHGTTLYVVLMAAFEVLLHGHAGETRPLLSSPTRFVDAAAATPLMGMFTGTVPVMVEIAPEQGFDRLLAQTRSLVLDGISRPHVQLDDLLRQPALRGFARPGSPYHAQFSYEDISERPAGWGRLAVEQRPLLAQEVTEDLMIWFFDRPAGLSAQLLHDAGVFDAATIDGLLERYAHLLARIADAPSASIVSLLGGAPAKAAPTAAAQGAAQPRPAETAATASVAAALTPAEAVIAEVWSDLLGIGDIGPQDNFIDLGGHSLLAMTMISRVEKRTGVRLNLLKVANNTLRVLAMEIPAEASRGASRNTSLGARLRRLFGRGDASGEA